MSSDGKEPGARWHGAGNPDWGQSLEHAHQSEYGELPLHPDTEDEGALPLEMPEFAQEEDDYEDYEDDQAEPASTPLGLFKQFGQYITLIITPLLFGALTCLFVLPLIASHKAFVPPVGLWPLTAVIIAIAVAQGIGVYYAGSDNGLWALVTVGGFFLFLLVGCFAVFGPISTLVLFLVLLVISVVLARLYVQPVAEGYVDIVYSFGKYSRTLYAGFNILLPWEKVVHQLNVGEKQWACPLQKVQLSRDEDVVLCATVSYQLLPEDAHIAVIQVNQWEESLKGLVLATIQSIATTFTPDDFIAWPQGLHSRPLTYDDMDGTLRWERVNAYLFQTIRDQVALWGVQINWVHIRDVSLAPHGATIVETDPIVDMPTSKISNPAPAAPLAQAAKVPAGAQKNGKSSGKTRQADDTTQVVPNPVQAPAPESAPAPVQAEPPNEKVLIGAYKAVQDGKITDPDTIRRIAENFKLVARDPKARETVNFDAERAATILETQAQKYEMLSNTGQLYDDETRPDWHVPHPPDKI
jgi:SPFH domain / Band 7 family